MGNITPSTRTISNLNGNSTDPTAGYDNFFLDTIWNAFVIAPVCVLFTLSYEFQFRFYWSFMYVFLFPIWFFMAYDQKWDLTDIQHNATAQFYGLEFIQYAYINSFHEMMVFHFTVWPFVIGPYGETMIMFMMFPRWIADVIMLLLGMVGITVGFIPHIIFIIAEIVFTAWPEGWYEYLRFLGFADARLKYY